MRGFDGDQRRFCMQRMRFTYKSVLLGLLACTSWKLYNCVLTHATQVLYAPLTTMLCHVICNVIDTREQKSRRERAAPRIRGGSRPMPQRNTTTPQRRWPPRARRAPRRSVWRTRKGEGRGLEIMKRQMVAMLLRWVLSWESALLRGTGPSLGSGRTRWFRPPRVHRNCFRALERGETLFTPPCLPCCS